MRALTLIADRKLELADLASPAAPAAGEADDVEEVVSKLYRPILDRIRRDLLIERERAGLLIDRR